MQQAKSRTRKDLLKRLTAHRRELDTFGVKSLALFGSAGRDELTPESDVDVLVQFDGAATFDRYMDLKFYLEDLLGRSVDLVTVNALKPALRSTVERDAVYVS